VHVRFPFFYSLSIDVVVTVLPPASAILTLTIARSLSRVQ
jgi:hypothetical protein